MLMIKHQEIQDLIFKLTQDPKVLYVGTECPLKDEHCSYPAVVGRFDLQPPKDPLAFLHEMARVVKWEGRVLVVAPLNQLDQLEGMFKQADLTIFEQIKQDEIVVIVGVKQTPENYALGCCG
jgi:ubiquinone/menaquinone biosynthesis C-methylase UbiE